MGEVENINSTFSLIFNEEAQNAVLGHLLLDQKFFIQCLGKIYPNYFNNSKNAIIYSSQLELFKKKHDFPTLNDVLNYYDVYNNKQIPYGDFKSQFEKCIDCKLSNKLDTLREKMTAWMQAMVFKKHGVNAINLYNSGRVGEALELMTKIDKERREISFEDTSRIIFGDFEDYLKKSEENIKNALPTGLKLLDKALLEGSENGGLLRGNTTIVMAPTDSGKTSTLITMACHNVLTEHPVLFMTHEGVPEDIKLQTLCCMMSLIEIKNKSNRFPNGLDRLAIYELKETAEGRKKIKYATDLLDQFLEYRPYNKPGMTIEDVEPEILRAQDSRAALNNGKGFDLLVSDYPAKLSTRMASHGHMPWHIVKQVVYDYYVQLAISNKFHSLLAIQTNREGYKTNKGHGSGGQRLLTPDDVADSYNVTQLANNIISVNRDDKSMLNNLMTLLVCKSKNSKTGKAIVCRTNFGCRVTHTEELGSTCYDNSDSMRNLVNSLLDINEIKMDGTPVDESIKQAFKENII
ncbi:MAG: hypothetical protein KGO96_07630 [Elusimicrobia bacterium]|nr:hypothetical protein [Elusimicrobiota bacterium]